jgi:molybdenum cofactor cytidylyltransferase
MQETGALILAAGGSSRFGQPKQLVQLRGKSLIRRIVDAADEAHCSPIFVVVGNDNKKICAELAPTSANSIENKKWQRGIGTSIRAGVEALTGSAPEVEAIVLLTCDQPFVEAQTIEQLLALREKTKKAIVASGYSDTLGVPALFDRSCFDELLALDDESGAKPIILSNRERVAEFPFPDGKIDIDTMEDLERLTETRSSRME